MNTWKTAIIALGIAAATATIWSFNTQCPITPQPSAAVYARVEPAPSSGPVLNLTQPHAPAKAQTTKPSPRVRSAAVKKLPSSMALIGPHRLASQHFQLLGARDTVLKTAGGCTVHVPANTLVTANGSPAKGRIDLEIKEVLKPIDFVMGNLSTTYNGRPLESGGTFFIAARAGGEELAIAAGRSIDMVVPTFGAKAGMKLFPGEVKGEAVVWNEPAPLALAQMPQQQPMGAVLAPIEMESDSLTTNVTYYVDGFEQPSLAPRAVTQRVSEIAWANGGLWITRDSTFTIGKHTVHFIANAEVTSRTAVPAWNWGWEGNANEVVLSQSAGWNPHATDTKLNYVFSVAKLGWANIDRLLNDKRTRPVDIITRIDNAGDTENLRITLVMKSHNLYIPGYLRKDGSYSFSHGDNERMLLPVGAKAVVVATAGTYEKTLFAMQPIVVEREGRIDLHLQPTTEAELKAALLAAL